MEGHEQIPYLREIVIFLVASGIVVPALQHVRVSPVLGYLIVGGLIGPFGLGLLGNDLGWLSYAVVTHVEEIKPLAELGVIFLLFVIGLELSFRRLWNMRRFVFGLGAAQVAVSAAVIGVIAWGWGNTPRASVILGACLALSSTAIVMQLLIDRRSLGSPLGRSSFSILLFQDLAVVPILFLLGVFGAQPEGGLASTAKGFTLAIVQAVAVIAAIYAVGRLLLRPLFQFVSRTGSPEMFMAAVLLVVIGTSAITGAAGLSMALGAFLTGLLLAGTEFRREIEVDIEPFKGLLLGFFFMTVGMGIDIRVVAQDPIWIVAAVVGLFAVKSVITGALCFAFGLPRHVSIETALLLGQAGEFAFVVVGLAMSLDLVAPDIAQFVLIVVGLSMVVTPVVAAAGHRLSRVLERRYHKSRHADELSDAAEAGGHVLIAGYGRVGRLLSRILEREGMTYLAFDLDGRAVGEHRASGVQVFYGDASRVDLLRRAGAESAAAVVVTMDNPVAAEHVVASVHRHWPDLPIYARARDLGHAESLRAAGATDVVPETFESSLHLGLQVLRGFGMADETALRRVDLERQDAVRASARHRDQSYEAGRSGK